MRAGRTFVTGVGVALLAALAAGCGSSSGGSASTAGGSTTGGSTTGGGTTGGGTTGGGTTGGGTTLPPVPIMSVGSFRASAELDKTSLELGDAATLRFRVEGTGNLKWIEEGPVVEIPETEVFPPQVRSDLKMTPRGAAGSKTWEYVVVPETGGTIEVPPLAFVYFDPRTGKIERAETQPLRLEVRGGVASSARVAGRGERGSPAMRASLDPPRRLLPAISAGQVALALALALALHGALWMAPRLGALRHRRAGRVAPRRNVKHALLALQRVGRDGSSKEAAAAQIEKCLLDLFGSLDGSAEPTAGHRTARDLLEEVQFIRYAPQLGDYDDKIRELASRASEVVRRWA